MPSINVTSLGLVVMPQSLRQDIRSLKVILSKEYRGRLYTILSDSDNRYLISRHLMSTSSIRYHNNVTCDEAVMLGLNTQVVEDWKEHQEQLQLLAKQKEREDAIAQIRSRMRLYNITKDEL